MLDRRTFVNAAGASLVLGPTLFAWEGRDKPRKRLAVVTTEWRDRSHAWHMAERFIVGYPKAGRWHRSPFEVVSAYVDQTPENDLSRSRSAEFGFKLYPSI